MFKFDQTNTFCINLDRRADRWERISEIFKETGLSVSRWKASEPKDVFDRIHGTPSQQACSQSHIRIWRHMIENDIEYALILEDDITFDKGWREKLETLKKPYDLIMLNTDHYYSFYQWSHTRGESWLTGAYIITKNCAEKILQIKNKIGCFLPSDHMLIYFQKETENKNCYSYFPYLAIQTSKDSDISGSIPEISYTRTINELKNCNYSLSNYIGMEDLKNKENKEDKLYLYSNSFWQGFEDKTDPVNINFFLSLFSKVYNKPVVSGTFENSDILIESFFGYNFLPKSKNWKNTFFFSGESQQRFPIPEHFSDVYSLILRSKNTNKNTVNLPEFIPYLYSSNLTQKLIHPKKVETIPPKDVVVIISNGDSAERNFLLDQLENRLGKHKIEYRGPYRNNAPIITAKYNTDEFYNEISQYKFIISLENSRDDTYVTEKITHGLIAGIVPIYWGSKTAFDYFNKERFLYLDEIDEKSVLSIVDDIVRLSSDNEAYLNMVNHQVLVSPDVLSLDNIVKEIQDVIFS